MVIEKKLKSKRGVVLSDIAIALIIIMIFGALLLTVFYNIYLASTENSRRSTAVNYIVNLLEFAEASNFSELTEKSLEDYRDSMGVQRGYEITIKFLENSREVDLLKQIEVNVQYKLGRELKEIKMETIVTNELLKWNQPEEKEVMTEGEYFLPRFAYKKIYYETEHNRKLAHDLQVANLAVNYETSYYNIDLLFLQGNTKNCPEGYEIPTEFQEKTGLWSKDASADLKNLIARSKYAGELI